MIEVTAVRDPDSAVGLVRFADGERNYLSPALIAGLADAYGDLDAAGCRSIVLSTPSRHFCAGAHFTGDNPGRSRAQRPNAPIYDLVPRLFARRVPVVAVVDGAAIGGGLGLAMSADFRVAGPAAKFSANFSQIGMSPGFGLTFTLQRAIGRSHAAQLLYTGQRIGPEEAARIGLCESIAETREVAEAAALSLAREIATSAPQAIHAIHDLLNPEIATVIRATLDREHDRQRELYATTDFEEGVAAARERRAANFTGA